MSRFKGFVVMVFAVALLAPAAQAGSAVKAVVTFVPAVTKAQRVATIRSAGGRVVKVRRADVVARMSVRAASQLRTAMGVTSVQY